MNDWICHWWRGQDEKECPQCRGDELGCPFLHPELADWSYVKSAR